MMVDDIAGIAAGLTKAQRDMLLRPPGRYQDRASDILALLDAEIWGTVNGPKYEAVRNHLKGSDND